MKLNLHKINPLPVPDVKDRLRCATCGRVKNIVIEREVDHRTLNQKMEAKRAGTFKPAPATGWRYLPIGLGNFCTNYCAVVYANHVIAEKEAKVNNSKQ